MCKFLHIKLTNCDCLFSLLRVIDTAKEALHSRRFWQCNQETSSCSTLSHRNIHKTKISGINNVSLTSNTRKRDSDH